jgi:serine/threonine protein kinase, bacterial
MNTTLINNRYHILQNLGRGGFGETFLAVDTHLPSGRNCVVKRLKPLVVESDSLPWIQNKFQQEAAILEQLGANNPQIPNLYAYFTEEGEFYLVQEWIEGLSLSEKVARSGKMNEADVRRILVDLLPVLEYLHSLQILHRDIKPDNIILRARDNKPVLIDFGAVKEAVGTILQSQTYSQVSMAVGTPGYMSPEQAAGRPIYSSDLYSLGLTAIYLLTGKQPQALDLDPNTGEILWRKELPNLHSDLAMAIDRSIRFNPRDRFSSAKEMLSALRPPSQASVPSQNSKLQKNSAPTNPSRQQTLAYKSYRELARQNKAPTNPNNWLRFLFGFFATISIAVGAFAVGFWLTFQPENSKNADTVDDPSVFPSENSSPSFKTSTPKPTAEATPTPTRTTIRRTRRPTEQTPTERSTEQTNITPVPTPTPTPIQRNTQTTTPTQTPTPEATVTPTPTPTSTPQPIETILPIYTPPPEATAAPTPTPEVTPTTGSDLETPNDRTQDITAPETENQQ